jgi:DNA-binding NtrC family response regulator
VAGGTFRQDLFYRLNVFPLEMPPLRERREDIPVLVEYFIDRYARKAGKTIRRVNKRTLDRLQSYPWPGNVRELQNVIERSVIVGDTDEFTVDESWLSTAPAVESPHALAGTLAGHEKRSSRTPCARAAAGCSGRRERRHGLALRARRSNRKSVPSGSTRTAFADDRRSSSGRSCCPGISPLPTEHPKNHQTSPHSRRFGDPHWRGAVRCPCAPRDQC